MAWKQRACATQLSPRTSGDPSEPSASRSPDAPGLKWSPGTSVTGSPGSERLGGRGEGTWPDLAVRAAHDPWEGTKKAGAPGATGIVWSVDVHFLSDSLARERPSSSATCHRRL